MATKREGDPWMSGVEYARLLPPFTINLVVREVPPSVAFYRSVLGAEVRYSDPDFAALKIADLEFMLHADHTYDEHPWYADLASDSKRGLGAELRLIGIDPDQVEARAREIGATVVKPTEEKARGREVVVADPDGYVWAVGVFI